MRNTAAICGKETRIYLTTWTSYILFGAFMVITAFFFYRLVVEFQMRSMQYMQMQAQQMVRPSLQSAGGIGRACKIAMWRSILVAGRR